MSPDSWFTPPLILNSWITLLILVDNLCLVRGHESWFIYHESSHLWHCLTILDSSCLSLFSSMSLFTLCKKLWIMSHDSRVILPLFFFGQGSHYCPDQSLKVSSKLILPGVNKTTSSHILSCSLVSIHFLCDILKKCLVQDLIQINNRFTVSVCQLEQCPSTSCLIHHRLFIR